MHRPRHGPLAAICWSWAVGCLQNPATHLVWKYLFSFNLKIKKIIAKKIKITFLCGVMPEEGNPCTSIYNGASPTPLGLGTKGLAEKGLRTWQSLLHSAL